jgi:hypothetical protein
MTGSLYLHIKKLNAGKPVDQSHGRKKGKKKKPNIRS